jgi:hypothetical protein
MRIQRAEPCAGSVGLQTARNYTLPLFREVDGPYVVCKHLQPAVLTTEVTVRLRGAAKLNGVVPKTMLI